MAALGSKLGDHDSARAVESQRPAAVTGLADTPVTEITLTGDDRVRVEGDPHTVERAIVSAARGSIMELAWLTEAHTGLQVAVNPEHVSMLRVLDPGFER